MLILKRNPDAQYSESSTDKVDMEVEITNQSKEALSGVSIGLAVVPTKGSECPASYADKKTLLSMQCQCSYFSDKLTWG